MNSKISLKRMGVGVLVCGILAVVQQPAGAGELADVDQFRATSYCVECDLAGVNFDLEVYGAASLSGANLYLTSFLGADLSGADLSNANLGLAVLEGANLSGANLSGADLWRAHLTGADLTGVVTDENTTCPDATPGPCVFIGGLDK